MKTVVVFCAMGTVGGEIVTETLPEGPRVSALKRKDTYPLDHERLNVASGDSGDFDAITDKIAASLHRQTCVGIGTKAAP